MSVRRNVEAEGKWSKVGKADWECKTKCVDALERRTERSTPSVVFYWRVFGH